jgi:predicted dithiol-disulfide oxidoreductase (DUF899 family)
MRSPVRNLTEMLRCSGQITRRGARPARSIADGFNGIVVPLENHDVAFSAASRAPLAKLQAYKQRMGCHPLNRRRPLSVPFTELAVGVV